MSGIRALRREDLTQVVDLYERVMRGGSGPAAEGLRKDFERLFFENPWTDPEIPSLVFEKPDGTIVAFIGSTTVRMAFRGEPVRLACCGPLFADPEGGVIAVGARLMQTYLKAGQDLTFSDGATESGRRLWTAVGSRVSWMGCIHWTRILRPFRLGGGWLSKKRALAPLVFLGTPFTYLLDGAASRWTSARTEAPAASEVSPLTSDLLVQELPRLAKSKALVPRWDKEFLDWQFGELARPTSRGALHTRAVRNGEGEVLGWYIYYVQPKDIAQVVQLVAMNPADNQVLGHLLHDARTQGAVAVRGRVDPMMLPAFAEQHCILQYREPYVLIHSERPELINAIEGGNALFTRLEGEWWRSIHRESYR